MKAKGLSLQDYIEKVHHFNVPRYQRAYSWSKEQCELLWEDILLAGEKDTKHFLGCIICVDDESPIDQNYLIIDGQQRIMTTMLLLEAIARSIDANDKSFGDVKSRALRDIMCREDEDGKLTYKISLSENDQKHFDALIDREYSTASKKSQIIKNFNFFTGEIRKLEGEGAKNLYNGLSGLQVVAIRLNFNFDKPQQVFEDMNFKGKGLRASDLVRNHMLMDFPLEKQETLYKRFMLPMETCLHKGKKDQLEDFLRDYLVVKKAEGVAQKSNIKRIYDEFRTTFRSEDNFAKEELLKDMRIYSEFYADLVTPDRDSTPPPIFLCS